MPGAGTRLRRGPQIPPADPIPISFETTESQELTQDSHTLSTGKAEWDRARAKSNKVPKDRR